MPYFCILVTIEQAYLNMTVAAYNGSTEFNVTPIIIIYGVATLCCQGLINLPDCTKLVCEKVIMYSCQGNLRLLQAMFIWSVSFFLEVSLQSYLVQPREPILIYIVQ